MVLHELCTALNMIGHRAGVAFIVEGSQDSQGFKFGHSAERHLHAPDGIFFDYFSGRSAKEIASFVSNSVAIYPDIVRGNPLGGCSYVTYVLGVPKFEIIAPFVLTFSTLYTEKADGHLFKPFLSPYMTDTGSSHWTTRPLSLTYIGKGSEYLECHVVPGTVLVERDWPRDKAQLGALLRCCKYFISWDCVSATNFDAVMCGAVPVLMHDLQIPRAQLAFGELGSGSLCPIQDHLETVLRDVRTTPPNITEIDHVLDASRNKAREYLDNWLANVAGVASEIIRKL